MMNSQRSDVEKISLPEQGKKIGINEVMKGNEIISNSFKTINYVSKDTTCKQLIKMKSCCLKCRKDTENINPRVSNTSNDRKTILSNAQYAVEKIKKPKNC